MERSYVRREQEALIDLSLPVRCHLVGIGGPGMQPIARLLADAGHRVSGSDLRDGEGLDDLRSLGVVIHIGHDAAHVGDADVVVFSTAIPESNVELQHARAHGVRCCHRSAMLASLCAATRAVGVAGAHGKTTTSALLTDMLLAHQAMSSHSTVTDSRVADSTLVHHYIGAATRGRAVSHASTENPTVARGWSRNDVFVIEADESDGTLDVLPLWSLIITNIDVDHLDYYETFDNVKQGFADVAARVMSTSADAVLVVNADDPHSADIRQRWAQRCRTFGESGADVCVLGVRPTQKGTDIDLSVDGETHRVSTALRGAHNALNLAAATAMATALGVAPVVALEAASGFVGVERRFDEQGEWNGALVVDDYAHLPAEIEATLAAARSHPRAAGRVIAVFQPNRFHRIAAMAEEYGECFGSADVVVITDIYASGTTPIPGVTGELVSNAVRSHHDNVIWAPTRADVVAAVRGLLAPGDVCVGMGCGDIATLAADLVSMGGNT